jgi:two-component system sensor histidine kinase DegS
VSIHLEMRQEWIILSIQDNGVGFEPGQVVRSEQGGWGILIMRERALAVGGMFEVLSGPGGGTVVRVKVAG